MDYWIGKGSMPTFTFVKPLIVVIGLCLISQAQVVFSSGAQITGGTLTPIGLPASFPLTGATSYNLNMSSVPVSTLGPWAMSRFTLINANGKDFTPYRGANNAWVTYFGGCCVYGFQTYKYIFSMAATQGFSNPEGAFVHITTDYTTADTYASYDQFDYEEMPTANGYGSPIQAVNGVFVYNGMMYIDKTVQSYCPQPGTAGTCPTYTAAPYTFTYQLYFGNQIPFDTANLVISSSTATGVAYQYWNGSAWTNFTPITDTTSGMTATGQIVNPPPSDWVRTVVNGSQSKYWWRITLGGGSVTINRLYGVAPKTGTTAWGYSRSACVSQLINVGTDVEYCGTPGTGHSAHFLQQSRALTGYITFWLNPSYKQGAKLIAAYVEQAAAAGSLKYPGQNGILLDNAGGSPTAKISGLSTSSTDFDNVRYSTWQAAWADTYTATHALFNADYGTTPKWWDGVNVGTPSNTALNGRLDTAMNWTLSENFELTNNALNANTAAELYFCNNTLWCPMGLGSNPNNSILMDSILGNQIAGVLDGSGSTVGNYHLWDMADRDPMMALAMFWIYRTDNVGFIYNTVGFNYFGVLDDYYYFVNSNATLNGPISPAVCTSASPCSIPLTQALGVPCPKGWEVGCVIRIGGKDVAQVSNYSGATLSATTKAIVNSYSPGATIEYVVQSNQSMDSPLHTPIYMYGSWFPAMAVNLGTPDSTYGFNYPCNGSYLQASPGCLAVTGLSAKGAGSTCNNANRNWCSPLLRRDFTGGPHGYTLVLVRPASYQNRVMGSTEYDVPGAPYSLPSAMYQLHADGSFTGPISSVTLKGGEAGIFVSH
jgi:hypothetical protein